MSLVTPPKVKHCSLNAIINIFLYKPTTLEILEIQQIGFFDVIGKSQWVVKTQKNFRVVKKLERYVRTGILSDNEKCASYLCSV